MSKVYTGMCTIPIGASIELQKTARKIALDGVLYELEKDYDCSQLRTTIAFYEYKDASMINEKQVRCEVGNINGWISVDDRLPEDDAFVLAYVTATAGAYFVASYNEKHKVKAWSDYYGNVLVGITDWQPLPKKEETK